MSWNNLKHKRGCPKCGGKIKLTLNEIKERLKEISPNIIILSDEYINSNAKLKCKCKIDGHEWSPTWGSLSQGIGCPACVGKVVTNKNSIRALRPDLIKYLLYEKDSDKYTPHSNKKIKFKCPECGYEKKMLINRLSNERFACNICDDGISIPEKFCANILKQLDMEFSVQKSFCWSKNKRYDFFYEQ